MYKLTNTSHLFIENSELYLKGNNGIYSINDKAKTYVFLPLLETRKNDFIRFAIEANETLDSVRIWLNTLIKYPFDNKMEHWSLLALLWIDTTSFIDNIWLYEIDDKWMSQKLKHEVHKRRKQLQVR